MKRCLHEHGCCGFEWYTHWPDEDHHHCHEPPGHDDDHECACGTVREAELERPHDSGLVLGPCVNPTCRLRAGHAEPCAETEEQT